MDAVVVFTLDAQRFALYLSTVHRVVRAVAIARLPKAPSIVLGIINVHGVIVPVVDVRSRFGLLPRDLALTDKFIIAHAGELDVAVVADAVLDVADCPAEVLADPEDVVPGTSYVTAIAKLQGGITLIHDLETFLSLDEQRVLTDALVARSKSPSDATQ